MNQPANMGNMYKYVTISQAVGHWMELTMCGQGYRMISDITWYQISPYLTISSDLEWSRVTQGYSRSVSSWWFDLDLIWDILIGLMWGTSRIDHSVVKSCWQLVRRSQLKRVSPWLGRIARGNHTGSVIIGDHRWSSDQTISIDFLWGFPQVSHFWNKSICFNHLYISLYNHL